LALLQDVSGASVQQAMPMLLLLVLLLVLLLLWY
jgi:hypothetical protein